LPEEQREAKAKQLAREEASRPFDLTTGPLLRATLLYLASQEHVLLVTMHHIVSDGWSMGIFYRELSALYEPSQRGTPPLFLSFHPVWRFCGLAERMVTREVLDKQLVFWKDHLGDLTTLELPTDRLRPSVQTFHGAAHTVEFPESLTEALRGLSHKEGATLFMTLLTAFQSLLHRYNGAERHSRGHSHCQPESCRNRGIDRFFL